MCESTLSYTRAETLLELMQGIFICSEIASVGEKKGEVGSRQKSGSGPVRCDTQDASSGVGAGMRAVQDGSDGQRLKAAPRALPLHFPSMCSEIIVSNLTFVLFASFCS